MFSSRSFVLGPWCSLYQIYQSRSKEGKLGYQNSFRVKQKTTDLQFLWGLDSHVCFQIRRKYAKFLETCYREQSQFLVGTASYRGTTELVDNELGLGGDAVRFFYFGQREGGSELKCYVKQLKNWYKLVFYLFSSAQFLLKKIDLCFIIFFKNTAVCYLSTCVCTCHLFSNRKMAFSVEALIFVAEVSRFFV